jgi:hypothetical protein
MTSSTSMSIWFEARGCTKGDTLKPPTFHGAFPSAYTGDDMP